MLLYQDTSVSLSWNISATAEEYLNQQKGTTYIWILKAEQVTSIEIFILSIITFTISMRLLNLSSYKFYANAPPVFRLNASMLNAILYRFKLWNNH